MDIKAFKLLLIEDNLTDANWISVILERYTSSQSHIQHVQNIQQALDCLSRDNFDAIVLDLFLPDSQGLESLHTIQRQAPQLPIIVLTATDDLEVAVQSLRQGAQDFLVKGEFEGKILARSIHYAVERQRIEFKTRQQALMKKMLDRIRNSIKLETVLKTTAKEIQRFLRTDEVLVYRRQADPSGSTAVISSSDRKLDRLVSERLISALNIDCFNSMVCRPTAVKTVEDTGVTVQQTPEKLQQVKSYLVLPIWLSQSVDCVYEDLTLPLIPTINPEESQEGLWGTAIAYNTQKTRKWQEWEIEFLQRLTTQVTIAIEQSQICCRLQTVNQQLQQLAILDGLTSIANRRYFDLMLNNEWQRLTREQKPLSLVLCDIDCFKAYNDAYGHQQGDLCLQEIAKILQKSTRRPADLVARYGGEEFAIILPNTDARGALFIAKNIARELAHKQLPHKQSSVSKYVTCSMGISTTVPKSDLSTDSIIQTADRLLYLAKKSGRNQVCMEHLTAIEN